MQTNVKEEYLRAMRAGQKEKKEFEAAGRSPYPAVLEDVCPEIARSSATELPVQEIPADRIVGIRSRGRISAFSASFLPLPEPGSEFAAKWMALCEAHLSDTGIREPILCYEYLGDFYVQEGNKRASVLKWFGAVRIPARVLRVLPADRSTPEAAAYFEFLDFYKDTGLYDIRFRTAGSYAKLYAALGRKPGEPWTDAERKHLASVYGGFREAFEALGGRREGLAAEDALLLFLRVHPYEELGTMDPAGLKKSLSALWGDVEASAAGSGSVTFGAVPGAAEKKSVLGKLISGAPSRLTAAFLYPRDPETSMWTRGHAQGAAALTAAFPGAVTVRNYFHADTPEDAENLIGEAASDGADLVFTTTPPLLGATLRAAVRYPKLRFFNCSAAQPLSSVRTYYCRAYEGKFITGMIAGAMAENGLIGYVGSYPILGVPASVNAFALGARMTNPRARILLEWSCLGGDCAGRLAGRGTRVISNRDVPLPDPACMGHGSYGLFRIGDDGIPEPLASPCWMWSKLYENILRSALDGTPDKKDRAVSYWWGMDSGVMDVVYTDLVPEGVRALAEAMADRLRHGETDPFLRPVFAQDGSVLSDGSRPLTPMEILHMDRLSDAVEGRIPEYGELLPVSRELVRELGIYADILPPDGKEDDE